MNKISIYILLFVALTVKVHGQVETDSVSKSSTSVDDRALKREQEVDSGSAPLNIHSQEKRADPSDQRAIESESDSTLKDYNFPAIPTQVQDPTHQHGESNERKEVLPRGAEFIEDAEHPVQSVQQRAEDNAIESTSVRKSDLQMIEMDDAPPAVRRAIRSKQMRGVINTFIYHHIAEDYYSVEFTTKDSRKAYHFDKDGNVYDKQ